MGILVLDVVVSVPIAQTLLFHFFFFSLMGPFPCGSPGSSSYDVFPSWRLLRYLPSPLRMVILEGLLVADLVVVVVVAPLKPPLMLGLGFVSPSTRQASLTSDEIDSYILPSVRPLPGHRHTI